MNTTTNLDEDTIPPAVQISQSPEKPVVKDIIYIHGASPIAAALPSNRRTSLIETLRRANPAINVESVLNILHEYLTGYTRAEHRTILGLKDGESLKRAMQQRAPETYYYLRAAEEVTRHKLEQMIATTEGSVRLGRIYFCAEQIGKAFNLQITNMVTQHLQIDVATGDPLRIPVPKVTGDIPF